MLDKESERDYKKVYKYVLHLLDFQCVYASKIMQYIMEVFMLTGVLRFRPDMLDSILPEVGDLDGIEFTLQEAWHVLFCAVLFMDIIYEFIRFMYNSSNMITVSKSIVAMILGTMLVYSTGFDGDRMLLAYAFWWVIKILSLWILKRGYIKTEIIHDTGSRGTAVCLPVKGERDAWKNENLEQK